MIAPRSSNVQLARACVYDPLQYACRISFLYAAGQRECACISHTQIYHRDSIQQTTYALNKLGFQL